MPVSPAPRQLLCTASLALVLLVAGCEQGAVEAIAGDPVRGKAAIRTYGCGSCHVIPGIPGADGRVGPPLDRTARGAYIAGLVPNTPEAMVRWLQEPEAIAPDTAMPDTGVSEADAYDITAYLYTLK